jgi:hypothetical protein
VPDRQDDGAGLVGGEIEYQPVGLGLDQPELAARQRRQSELGRQRLDAGIARSALARTEAHLAQRQPRRRQEPKLDCACDTRLHAERGADALLELGPVLAPVDEARPQQRRQQRRDEQPGQ